LAAWSSCSGPWWSAASELAVAPSSTPRLPELERLAGPSAPYFATTQCGSEFLRAPYCVPSWVVVCTQLCGHGSIRLGNATLTIETAAKFQIGPTDAGLFRPSGDEAPFEKRAITLPSLWVDADGEYRL
jgi:hypothetical protein